MSEVKSKLKGDRGVSPVIGVILMVAITVILAAVIGSFVLGIGGDVEKAPQASLSITDSDNTQKVNITHEGGDTIDLNNVNLSVDGNNQGSLSGTLSAGASTEIDVGTSGNTEIRLVHNPSDQLLASSELVVT